MTDLSKGSISQYMLRTVKTACRAVTPESEKRIVHFVKSQMNGDGGFRGRSESSDLYYTLFGMDCLIALNCPLPADRLHHFLRSFQNYEELDLVHLSCLARCFSKLPESYRESQRLQSIYDHMTTYRSPEGGYQLTRTSSRDSVYAAFLVTLVTEELGYQPNGKADIQKLILKYKTGDGGYADYRGFTSGTTTVTSAAVILQNKFGLEPESETKTWLLNRQSKHGGFVATPDTPAPDLLSTATALLALKTWQIPLPETMRNATLTFVESLWDENGGFCGNILETTPDCEYTYYGLLSLGALLE